MSTPTTQFFDLKPGKDQARDTGMALVLLLLLVAMATKRTGLVTVAAVVHVVNMIAPQIFKPAAIIWFGFSHILGTVMSKVVLSLVFFLVVTPVSLWRKVAGADSLQLRQFKAARTSVMFERNHRFTAQDLEKPY
jgi:hypothetical protein